MRLRTRIHPDSDDVETVENKTFTVGRMKLLRDNISAHIEENIYIRTTKNFVHEATDYAVDKIIQFAKGVWEHLEGITLLILSSFGLNALLSELPFIFTLPLWIEGAWVIPIIAIILVSLLCKLAEWRRIRRLAL